MNLSNFRAYSKITTMYESADFRLDDLVDVITGAGVALTARMPNATLCALGKSRDTV